jgi:hypothetical protein
MMKKEMRGKHKGRYMEMTVKMGIGWNWLEALSSGRLWCYR